MLVIKDLDDETKHNTSNICKDRNRGCSMDCKGNVERQAKVNEQNVADGILCGKIRDTLFW